GVPVIVVSRALQGDIERFAGPPLPTMHVVDNAVSQAVFHPDPTILPEPGRFFTLAAWRFPKRPDLLLDALVQLRAEGYDARLRIAGVGPGSPAMIERIASLGLGAHVELLGQLDEHAVADEMRRAHALVHASDYETYSAVCAEALCCGTSVIASRVGGIPEFVTDQLGVLVPENSVAAWVRCWKEAWQPLLVIDRNQLAATMAQRAGSATVGAQYHRVLKAVLDEHRSSH
ncbi:MAG: glycosyltransferase family 4 protein, partial [Flavobacteriales bacterium]|nr:glycosyltransferase family 4 protein [Flavobacteriales bacterium]